MTIAVTDALQKWCPWAAALGAMNQNCRCTSCMAWAVVDAENGYCSLVPVPAAADPPPGP